MRRAPAPRRVALAGEARRSVCGSVTPLASPFITRLYDKARAPKDAALECVARSARKEREALPGKRIGRRADCGPRVVAQVVEGVFREASPIKVVGRVPKASPPPARL